MLFGHLVGAALAGLVPALAEGERDTETRGSTGSVPPQPMLGIGMKWVSPVTGFL
jgi:hypothetical protein